MKLISALTQYAPLMLLRGGTIVLKFGLSIYIARVMGLGALGTYGLVVGATLVLPTFFRAGLTATIARTLVDSTPAHITHTIRHYLAWTFACYGAALLTLPFLSQLDAISQLQINVYLVWLIVLVEQLAADMALLLNNLYRTRAANVFGFVQTAAWVVPFIGLGLLNPDLRTVPALLAFWAGGMLLSLVGFGALFAKWPWRGGAGMSSAWFSSHLRASGYLYFADITGTLGQFIDRYLVALLIDLEHAGIYTLFFQLANAIYTLVASSIMNIHRPKVVSSFRKGEVHTGSLQLRALQREALLAMVGLSVVTGVAFHFAAPLLQRPMVLLFLPLLWCTFTATVCKAWCLTSFIALYARQLDRALFTLNVFILAAVSIGCLVVLPLLGIYGIPLVTGLTYLFTLFLIRRIIRGHARAV